MDEDERARLNQLFHYMNKTYQIAARFNQLTDTRTRRSVKILTATAIILIGLIMQKGSFNSMFNHNSFKRRIKNIFPKNTHIPNLDASRAIVEMLNTDELKEENDNIVKTARKNKVLREGTIDGLVVVGIDGMELFSSYKKCCKDCLERTHKKNGEEVVEYYHRAVVCMTVGTDPHVILGEEMLQPRDGNKKEEGEPTGAKRLIERLYKKHNHFADVVVGDALYMNAPFIEKVTCKDIDVVVRAKDTKRIILQDALGLVKHEAATESFEENKIKVKVWDIKGFKMEGVKKPLRFLQFEERRIVKKPIITRDKDKKYVKKAFKEEEEVKKVWVFTTSSASAKTVWRIIHARWDIENNGFHQLKTYYHADHCFEHSATENVFLLNIIAFNLRELFLYRRSEGFRESRQTRIDKTNEWLDDMLEYTFYEYFQLESG